MKVDDFEDLRIWQMASELCTKIYKITREGEFKFDSRFVQQIRASSGSIMDNIAEGFERQGNKEFKNFLFIAKGSAGEVRSQIIRTHNVGFISDEKYKELYDDLGLYIPNHGNLTKWANEGVLLLNTILTVRAHSPKSHEGIGWEMFTDAAIAYLNSLNKPIVYMLWGSPAGKKAEMLNNPSQLVLKAPHPSPLSAYRGFFGCKHFSKANEFLVNNNEKPIDWQIENV